MNNLGQIIIDWKKAYGFNNQDQARREHFIQGLNSASFRINFELKPDSDGFTRIENVTKKYLEKSDEIISTGTYPWDSLATRMVSGPRYQDSCIVLKVSPEANFVRFKPESFDEASIAVLESLDCPLELNRVQDIIYMQRMGSLATIVISTYAIYKIIPIIKWKILFLADNLHKNPTLEQINFIKNRPLFRNFMQDTGSSDENIKMFCLYPDVNIRYPFKKLMHEGIEDIPNAALNEIRLMVHHGDSLAKAVIQSQRLDNAAVMDYPERFVRHYQHLINELFDVHTMMFKLLNEPRCVQELNDVNLLPLYKEEFQKLYEIVHANAVAYTDLIANGANAILAGLG